MNTVCVPIKNIKRLELQFVKERIDNLPVAPSVNEALKQLSHDSIDFCSKVAALARHYPPLAVRILNCAHKTHSPPQPIFSCEYALERIGIFKTLELMKTLEEIQFMEAARPGVELCWLHSIETARLCLFLAKNTPGFEIDPDLAYISGLLHDIGRLVLLQVSVQNVGLIDSIGWDSAEELSDLEEQMFGFNHAYIGYLAARQWKLPQIIANMLRYHHHHNIWQSHQLSPDLKKLLILVQLADFLSVLMIKNPEWPAWSDQQLKGTINEFFIQSNWPAIGFPIDQLIGALPRIAEQSQRVLKSSVMDKITCADSPDI